MIDNIPYFDGHNDVLLKLLYSKSKNKTKDFLEGNDYCHIDFKKIQIANFIGGFFAIFSPNKDQDFSVVSSKMESESYHLELPEPISQNSALDLTMSMISILNDIIQKSNNKIVICKNGDELRNAYMNKKIAIVLHIEGAEAIDRNFYSLEKLYDLGLRSIGLVWSRPNIFGNGVPFSFPTSPDIGEGLTEFGKRLVKKCDEKNILIDLSHLNEKGFWDVAKLSSQPLIATHSNAHYLSNHSRNLTNKQLEAINESNGIVGVNFAPAFLRSDGKMVSDTKLDEILKHFDYLIKYLGENRVGIGSDFDGAVIPSEINDLAGTNELKNFMYKKGYGVDIIEKIFSKNWLNFLEKNL